jgi:23S rRNA (cytidine1920-2'-O)/16S rRNA (cytidine1409-2'-O)-methyltransferase
LQKTIRLDQLLVERNHCKTAKEAAGLIMSGRVLIDDQVADKPGTPVSLSTAVRIKTASPFVSRAGHKLQAGLDHFAIDPQGWICGDIGASTGGFTDCLLQRGARRVYAVDVAYGILDWKIRSDPRVVTLERTNARALTSGDIGEEIDFCVFDTSFISLTKVIPPVIGLFRNGQANILALVKPQFELPRHLIDEGGLVGSREHRLQAVEKLIRWCSEQGLKSRGFCESPLRGTKGNQEYLLYVGS